MKYILVWISLSVVLLFGLTQITFAQEYALSSSESEKIKEWNSILVLLLQENRFEIKKTAHQLNMSRNTVASRFKGICFEK